MKLGIAGRSVERVAFDFGVTLITDDGAEIRIETAFVLRAASHGRLIVDPSDPGDPAAVLSAVLHEMITSATADDSTGSLVLDFVHGAQLEVWASDAYEAWSFTTQGGVRVVALPGGGLSSWTSDL